MFAIKLSHGSGWHGIVCIIEYGFLEVKKKKKTLHVSFRLNKNTKVGEKQTNVKCVVNANNSFSI